MSLFSIRDLFVPTKATVKMANGNTVHAQGIGIILFQVGVNDRRTTWVIDGRSPCIKDADHA